jgi:hypothetical protein
VVGFGPSTILLPLKPDTTYCTEDHSIRSAVIASTAVAPRWNRERGERDGGERADDASGDGHHRALADFRISLY